MFKVTRQPWPGYEYQGTTVSYWETFDEASEACGGGTPDLVKRGVWESGDDEAHYEVIWEYNPNYPGQTAQQIADHKMEADIDDIVVAAERQYERENDTPTEPRSDLD